MLQESGGDWGRKWGFSNLNGALVVSIGRFAWETPIECINYFTKFSVLICISNIEFEFMLQKLVSSIVFKLLSI